MSRKADNVGSGPGPRSGSFQGLSRRRWHGVRALPAGSVTARDKRNDSSTAKLNSVKRNDVKSAIPTRGSCSTRASSVNM